MGGEKKVVEGRYWSYGVGGLWGFKGGWPGHPERSQAASVGWTRGRVLTARSAQSLSAEAQLSSPRPAAPPCSASVCPSSLLWPLALSTLLPQSPPFLSTAPYLSGPPASHPLCRVGLGGTPGGGGQPSQQPSVPQSPVPARVGSAWVGPSAQAAQPRPRKLAEDPALLRRTCQVQLALSV